MITRPDWRDVPAGGECSGRANGNAVRPPHGCRLRHVAPHLRRLRPHPGGAGRDRQGGIPDGRRCQRHHGHARLRHAGDCPGLRRQPGGQDRDERRRRDVGADHLVQRRGPDLRARRGRADTVATAADATSRLAAGCARRPPPPDAAASGAACSSSGPSAPSGRAHPARG